MKNYTTNKGKCSPTVNHPELIEFLVEAAEFFSKWHKSEIAKTVGISRQALDFQINKKKKGKHE